MYVCDVLQSAERMKLVEPFKKWWWMIEMIPMHGGGGGEVYD